MSKIAQKYQNKRLQRTMKIKHFFKLKFLKLPTLKLKFIFKTVNNQCNEFNYLN